MRRLLQLRVSTLGRSHELRTIARPKIAIHASNSRAGRFRFVARRTFPRAAPQGKERTATSKPRRHRSDTSGTRLFAEITTSPRASAQSVASPTAQRTLVAAPFLTRHHPGAFGPSSCLSRRSQFRVLVRAPVVRRAARQTTAWPSARPTGAVAAPAPAQSHLSCSTATSDRRRSEREAPVFVRR